MASCLPKPRRADFIYYPHLNDRWLSKVRRRDSNPRGDSTWWTTPEDSFTLSIDTSQKMCDQKMKNIKVMVLILCGLRAPGGPWETPECVYFGINRIPHHNIFSVFGGVPSGPACPPVGIPPLRLGAFGERVCWWDVDLLVLSAFAGGKSFCW